MTDSLADILGKRRYDEPPEVTIIKKFVREKYKSEVRVTIQSQRIILAVSGSALAGSLRFNLHEIQRLCKTKKRLQIQII